MNKLKFCLLLVFVVLGGNAWAGQYISKLIYSDMPGFLYSTPTEKTISPGVRINTSHMEENATAYCGTMDTNADGTLDLFYTNNAQVINNRIYRIEIPANEIYNIKEYGGSINISSTFTTEKKLFIGFKRQTGERGPNGSEIDSIYQNLLDAAEAQTTVTATLIAQGSVLYPDQTVIPANITHLDDYALTKDFRKIHTASLNYIGAMIDSSAIQNVEPLVLLLHIRAQHDISCEHGLAAKFPALFVEASSYFGTYHYNGGAYIEKDIPYANTSMNPAPAPACTGPFCTAQQCEVQTIDIDCPDYLPPEVLAECVEVHTTSLAGQHDADHYCDLRGASLRTWINTCEEDYYGLGDIHRDFYDFYFKRKNECGWTNFCDLQLESTPDCEINCSQNDVLGQQFCDYNEENYNDNPNDDVLCNNVDNDEFLAGSVSVFDFCSHCGKHPLACMQAYCSASTNTEDGCACLYSDANQTTIIDTDGYGTCITNRGTNE